MWWRFIIFCFLVSFILFVVLNFLHDRPVVHFRFFKKGDSDSEQIIYERFKDNFLKERLVAFEFELDNGTFVPEDVDIDEIMDVMREKLNVHDPNSREIVESLEEIFSATDKNDTFATDPENSIDETANGLSENNEVSNSNNTKLDIPMVEVSESQENIDDKLGDRYEKFTKESVR